MRYFLFGWQVNYGGKLAFNMNGISINNNEELPSIEVLIEYVKESYGERYGFVNATVIITSYSEVSEDVFKAFFINN